MNPWPKRPIIYEINTWVWLQELGKKKKTPVTLATVPKKEWDAIASLGFDAVCLMGVWERSPVGIRIAMKNEGLLADFRRALPDFTEADNVGSPYCVRRYEVDPHLGGREGLAKARKELAKRGMRFILDFVPNHVAPDHPWVTERPDYFIQGDYGDSVREPTAFIAKDGYIFACGRDPYFTTWPDVLQLNAFNGGLRATVIDTVSSIADQCDGGKTCVSDTSLAMTFPLCLYIPAAFSLVSLAILFRSARSEAGGRARDFLTSISHSLSMEFGMSTWMRASL